MLRRRDVGSLVDFSLLTRRRDSATSRHWNVTMLARRDVAATFSPASYFQLEIAKNHPFHLQFTKTPKIRSWAIMRLFKCKIN